MKDRTLIIVAVVSLLVLATGALFYFKGEKAEEPTGRPGGAGGELVRMHSPTLGKADAPVVIVEFLDPACSTCRTFYPLVKDMMAANPDRIRLVMRYAPFHKGSDKVVAALEAARKQGKFWPALEAVLAAQSDWVINHTAQVERVWKHFEGLGLNLEQMRTDMNAPEVASVIAQDVKDALALNVTKTPEFFVNGKPLPRFGYEELKGLVDEALAKTGR